MVPREAWIAVYMMADHYRGTSQTIGKVGAQVSRSVTD